MFCWGNNRDGQLGLGGVEEEIFASPVENKLFSQSTNVKQIACGFNHTLILLNDGTLQSCGNNDMNQLGHDGARTRPEQIRTLDIHFFVQIACGHSFSLALNNLGQLYCWGSVSGNREDELFFAKPTLIKGSIDAPVVQIACGYNFFLALTEDGKVFLMGLNNYGQLGIGNTATQAQPVHLKSLQGIPVQQIACGAHHAIVLTMSGNIFAFGKNTFGQLGTGDTQDRLFPMNLKFLNSQKACYISCGEDFTAVLTKDGGVFTFGAGMYGQLGHNSTNNEYLPRKVFDLMGSEITQITCGRCHTLAYLASSNKLYAFGLCGNGQLGVGVSGSNNKLSPVHLSSNLSLSKISQTSDNEAKFLNSIYAGGDQSFVLYSREPKQLDYRRILYEHSILTIDSDRLQSLIPHTQRPSSSSSTSIVDLPRQKTDKALQVFASAACLNASFLDEKEHYNTSNKYPGIDLKQARSLIKILATADSNVINVITQKLTNLFNSLPESPPSIEALRLYVTTPFFFASSLFDLINLQQSECGSKSSIDKQNIYMLFYAYAQSINRLRKEGAARVLDYWFAWTGVEFFKLLISIYKSIIVYIISLPVSKIDSDISYRSNLFKCSIVFLHKLHKINLEYREIVTYDTFYIPELIDKIDIKQDYFEWLRRQHLRTDNVLFCDYPFVFDARVKTLLLQTDADVQMQLALQDAWHQNFNSLLIPTIDPVNPFLALMVRRDQIVQDTLNQLAKQRRDDLKKPLKVVFINEDAYDAGGVKKEFFMLLLKEILDPKYGMFIYYEETRTIWFNDLTFEGNDMYHLIGELCGLAIYNSTIIDLPFPLALYKKLLKDKTSLQDMKSLSPTVAKSLEMVLNYEGDDFEAVFCLNFEITRQRFDETVVIELIPDGSKTAVTKENKKQYVQAYIDYIFNKSVESAFDAFNKGFHHVCGSKVLELFQPSELMAMVIGNQNYDFFELERCAEYKGDYSADHPVVKNFWTVFHSLDIDSKKKFLTFLTGSDRIPILGMKRVKITLQSTNGGDQYYPVAHTCFNLLDLPKYSNIEVLRDRLLQAIEHNQGFTLV